MTEILTRQEYTEKLLKGYVNYYDVTRCEGNDNNLIATAFFHARNSSYVLSKRAEMWAAQCNEYIYIFDVPQLTKEIAEAGVKYAEEDGMPRIKPDKEHMSSFIEAVFICDECDPDAKTYLTKYRNRKSFQFSLQGWMEVHTAAVILRENSLAANYKATENAKYLKALLDGKKSGGGKGRGLKVLLQVFEELRS